MLEQIRVTESSVEILEASCPVTGSRFNVGDMVVQCPGTCKRWYHVESWRYLNDRCATLGCGGSGRVSDRPPPEPPPPPPLDPGEITISPAPLPPIPNPEATDELLGQIEIVPQAQPEVIISSLSIDDELPAPIPQGLVRIEPWELMVGDVAKKMGVDDLFQKAGLRSLLSTRYFAVLGAALICLLALILILLVIILVSITH